MGGGQEQEQKQEFEGTSMSKYKKGIVLHDALISCIFKGFISSQMDPFLNSE